METSLDAAGDRAVVMPGIGQEYPVALELARRARSLGLDDGLLLMPRSQRYVAGGLTAHWRAIAETAQLPIVVYKRGLPDQPDLREIVADDAVIVCKYADKDVRPAPHLKAVANQRPMVCFGSRNCAV